MERLSFSRPVRVSEWLPHMSVIRGPKRVGRSIGENSRSSLPVRIAGGPPQLPEVHHALMDGLHVGRYFERLQCYFADPAALGPPVV
jgi:hypothetical protein